MDFQPITTRATIARLFRRGAVSRVVLAAAAGAMLATVTLVAWSCRTAGPIHQRVAVPSDGSESAPVDVSGVAREAIGDEPLVRVRVNIAVTNADLSRRAYWVIAAKGAAVGEAVPGPARVIASSGGIKVIDARGRVHGFMPGNAVSASVYTAAGPADDVELNGATYPGRLVFVPSDDGPDRFDVVNVTGIESYLPGVLSRELYSHWHESAFRVQAVAARTFALDRRENARRAGRHFDLESTTTDQVYAGSTSLRVAIDAVDATRGMILISSDRIAQAYYSSTCGGRPALPEEIWPPASGAATPVALAAPQQSEPTPWRETLCDLAPLYHWETLRDTDDLNRRLLAWAGSVGRRDITAMRSITAIEPTEHGASGRPILFELRGPRGNAATITAERLRIASNFQDGGIGQLPARARLHSNDLQIEIGRRVTRVTGRGHGHGVGLCQFCAQAMAVRGDHWRQMLSAFYPSAEVRRVY